MKALSIRLDKLIVLIVICMVFLLVGMYLNNVSSDRLLNTGVLQSILLVMSGAISFAYIKTSRAMLIISGLLLCFAMLLSSLLNYNETEVDFLRLISRCFLWFVVFLLGFVSTKSFDCEKIVPIIASVAMIMYIVIMLANFELDLTTYRKDTVVTAVYFLLCCVPFVLCLKQKVVKWTLISVVAVICFISFKRSALVVAGVAALALLFINIRKYPKMKYILLGVVAVIGCLAVFIFLLSGGGAIEMALDMWELRFSGGTDDRQNIWGVVVEMIRESNFLEKLIGHGYNAVANTTRTGLSAHNDYLEIIYDFGYISMMLFIIMVTSLLKICKSLANTNWRVYNGYICALVIFLVASIPSHMLTYSTYFLLLAFYLGYANGIEEKAADQMRQVSTEKSDKGTDSV